MLIKGKEKDGKVVPVEGITEVQKDAIKNYLLRLINVRLNSTNDKGEWFSFDDLMGGENRDWNGTPLQELYDAPIREGKDKDLVYDEIAPKNAGMLLKEVIIEDDRYFDIDRNEKNKRKYKWVENYQP